MAQIEKDKLVIRTLRPGVVGLEEGSWLYYDEERDRYIFEVSKNYSHTDIASYTSSSSIFVSISKATVEMYIGDMFEYVKEPFVIKAKNE